MIFKNKYVIYKEKILDKDCYVIYRQTLFGDMFICRHMNRAIAEKVFIELSA